MDAYVVKILEYERLGRYAELMRKFKKARPHTYTSKQKEATNAAKDNIIYAIVVEHEKGKTIYKFGYKFVSTNFYESPGGSSKWEGEWQYKNTVTYPNSVFGGFIYPPKLITLSKFDIWLRGLGRDGMTLIPVEFLRELEEMTAMATPLNLTHNPL